MLDNTGHLLLEKRYILIASIAGIIAIFAIRFLTPRLFAVVWQLLVPGVVGFYLAAVVLGAGIAQGKSRVVRDSTLAASLLALGIVLFDFFALVSVLKPETVQSTLAVAAIEAVVFLVLIALGFVGGLLGTLLSPRLPTLVYGGIGAFVAFGLMFVLTSRSFPEALPASRVEIISTGVSTFLIQLLFAVVTGLLAAWSAKRRGLVNRRVDAMKEGGVAGVLTGVIVSSALAVSAAYSFVCAPDFANCGDQIYSRGGGWILFFFGLYSFLHLGAGLLGGLIGALAARLRPA